MNISTIANLSILIGCAIALATSLYMVSKYRRQTILSAVIACSVLLSFAAPAVAMQPAGSSGTPDVDMPGRMSGDAGYEKTGNYKTMPTSGSQYQGLTHPEAKGTPLGDEDIERRIDAKVPNTIVYSVSNGSVRISGQVRDRRTAEKIVEDVQNIPGIHELAYDIEMTGVVSQ